MKNWRTIVKGAAFAVTLAAGTMLAQDVHTDFDENANFAQYRTFCYGKVHASNQLVENRIRAAVMRDLTAKGWEQTDAHCDVSVSAVGFVHDKQEYNTFYDGLGPGWGWRGRGWGGWGGGPAVTTVDNIPVGMLVVDLYDTRSKQLLWRGTSKQDLSDKPEKNAQKLNKAIDKMFDKFPPKSKG
ncbi:DUF4136 domain-containing protein [Granulicella sp. dw_53]|uniref:DUF4136 domain-containing protein n=1 Tax=Granulicella sp. dw_53 TaxID=2719792 RepID=UPI001BD5BEBE|nr:DUF4136 domain-containing protein [Granulicella sp. dw_53]